MGLGDTQLYHTLGMGLGDTQLYHTLGMGLGDTQLYHTLGMGRDWVDQVIPNCTTHWDGTRRYPTVPHTEDGTR